MNKELFFRNFDDEKSYKIFFYKNLNKLNYKKISKIFFNYKKYFNIDNFNNYLVFSFWIVKEWIIKNEVYTEEYIEDLEKLLKKLNIYKYLNSMEHEYIIHVKSIVFAKKRNLKKLIVDFQLEKFYDSYSNKKKEEIVFYSFENSDFFKLNDSNDINYLIKGGTIYISNKRIVCTKNLIIFSIKFDDISFYKMGKEYFEFIYNGVKYFIDTRNNYEFFVSYERIIDLFYE